MKKWPIKKLSELCEITAGGDIPKGNFSKARNSEYQIPIYANGEKNEGLYGFTNKAKITKPSITVSARGTIGYSAKRLIPFFPIVRLIVLTPINLKTLDLNFLKYALSKIDFKYSGSSIPQLTVPMIKEYKIPCPPLHEQQQIISLLDETFAEIDKAKSNAEQNLKNAKELFESYLHEVFENKGEDWVNSTIGETCNLQTGGTPRSSKKEFYEGGTIKWLVSGDINQKEIIDCEGRITELGMKSSNTKYLPINSILIALNGQGKTRGTVAMLRTKATCNQSLVSIFPKEEKSLLPDLLFANLEGRYFEIRKMTGDSGNDRRGLNMSLIKSIKFSYPKKINDQKEIIKKLNDLRSEIKILEAIYQKKINALEELKKSVLQKALREN